MAAAVKVVAVGRGEKVAADAARAVDAALVKVGAARAKADEVPAKVGAVHARADEVPAKADADRGAASRRAIHRRHARPLLSKPVGADLKVGPYRGLV